MQIYVVIVMIDLKDKGNAAFRAGKYVEAAKWYRKSLKVTPFETALLTNLAQAALKESAYEDALEWCERALFVDDKNVKGLFRRALAYKGLGRLPLAIGDLQAAIKLEPQNQDLAKELRMCQVRMFVLLGFSWACFSLRICVFVLCVVDCRWHWRHKKKRQPLQQN